MAVYEINFKIKAVGCTQNGDSFTVDRMSSYKEQVVFEATTTSEANLKAITIINSLYNYGKKNLMKKLGNSIGIQSNYSVKKDGLPILF